MMRLASLFSRSNGALWIAGAAAFCLSAIANAPASLVAAIATARSPLLEIGAARGTIWKGELTRVAHNQILIGDISYRLAPLSLATARIAADASSRNGALEGEARIALSPGGVELRDVSAVYNLASIRQYTFFGARYQGVAAVKAKSLKLTRAGCGAEEAKLSTNALDGLSRGWSGAAFPLAGDIKCVDGKFHLALNGAGAEGSVRINVKVAPDLSYEAVFTAEPRRADVGVALRTFGFEGPETKLSWRAVGRLKGLNS